MLSRLGLFLLVLTVALRANEGALNPRGAAAADGPTNDSLLPQQVIENFTLPRFNPEGDKAWEIRGESALFISHTRIRIENFVIEVLSPAGDASTVVRSPRAEIDLETRTARGDGFIAIDGPGFTVDGNRWTWDGKNRRVRIQDHAIVRLQDSVGGFLK